MLLGHWYLVQPGLRRDALKELVVWTGIVWPFEVAVFLWPTGMVQMFTGAVDDGYNGLLGVGLGGVRDHDDRPRRHDVDRAARAVLLRGDGRDRPALPRDPHRLRHGPHPPRRPVRNASPS